MYFLQNTSQCNFLYEKNGKFSQKKNGKFLYEKKENFHRRKMENFYTKKMENFHRRKMENFQRRKMEKFFIKRKFGFCRNFAFASPVRCRTARWEWMSLPHGVENLVFVFFIGTVVFELTFGRCENSKLVTCLFPVFLSFNRDLWVPQSQKNSTKNFEMTFFLDTLSKSFHSKKCFRFFPLVPEKPRVDPKKKLFLGWDELGSLHPRNISLASLFDSSRFGWTTQKFFFRDKNPTRLHVTS